MPLLKLIAFDLNNEQTLKEYFIELIPLNTLKPDHIKQIGKISLRLKKENLNIDYFPTNFVIKKDKLIYFDFECNPYESKWDFPNWGLPYWTDVGLLKVSLEKD